MSVKRPIVFKVEEELTAEIDRLFPPPFIVAVGSISNAAPATKLVSLVMVRVTPESMMILAASLIVP